MRRLLALSVVAVLVVAGTARVEETKTEAFLDKDLSGWEGLIKEYWSYKDGALIGYTEKDPGFNTFLASKKKYKDFELKFKVRLKDGIGNSGVQIRSKLLDMKRYPVAGPQVDIGAGYWGSLYGERFGGGMMQASSKEAQKAVKPKDFNEFHIKVVGKKVTIKINGETTVDQEFDKKWAAEKKGRQELPEEGVIAFQLHSGYKTMEVTFKDIEFKDLSAK